MRHSQRGLSWFGVLVILAIAAGTGYYLYQAISEVDEGPGCKDAFTSCMRYCRRTTTETAAAQSCQQACQRDFDACERGGR
ncbi:MAG TPA: hypothetical protein VI545_00690 [Burkholderiales bacterium]|nr:hypothetical protein [Burkholderiales bacterium]